jgi:hypothetical protein
MKANVNQVYDRAVAVAEAAKRKWLAKIKQPIVMR